MKWQLPLGEWNIAVVFSQENKVQESISYNLFYHRLSIIIK